MIDALVYKLVLQHIGQGAYFKYKSSPPTARPPLVHKRSLDVSVPPQPFVPVLIS